MKRCTPRWFVGVLAVLLCFGLALAEKTCPKCGTQNSDQAKFCKSCGAKLPASEPSRPAAPRVSGSVAVGYGTVTISSEPSGATVSIDGRSRGTTPLELTDVTTGRHDLTLSRDGYRDYNTTFTVSSQYGTIVVTSDPAGAEVMLDGQSRGPAGENGLVLSRVPYGSHTITTKLSGYQDVAKTIDLKSAGPIAMSFRLGWGKGYMKVVSIPPGAEISSGGRQLGKTPFLGELQPGRYLLTLTRPGYFDWVGYTDVQFAETAYVAGDLERVKRHSPLLLALGAAALGGTAFTAWKGQSEYALYQSATDPAEVLAHRTATGKWDLYRNIGAGATAAFVASFILFRF